MNLCPGTLSSILPQDATEIKRPDYPKDMTLLSSDEDQTCLQIPVALFTDVFDLIKDVSLKYKSVSKCLILPLPYFMAAVYLCVKSRSFLTTYTMLRSW